MNEPLYPRGSCQHIQPAQSTAPLTNEIIRLREALRAVLHEIRCNRNKTAEAMAVEALEK